MNQQLFDLDRALDDFEHEELDKLASGSTQFDRYSGKQFLRRSTSPPCPETLEDAKSKQREAIPSIICLLSSTSGAVSAGEMAERSVRSSRNLATTVIRADVLDEDAKDMCVDFGSGHIQASNDRTSHHLVLEDQSSNMDSGLCSSLEFASMDAGDFSTPASSQMSNSGNNALLQNLYTASLMSGGGGGGENYEHVFEAPNEASSTSHRSYSDDVAMLFSPEKVTSGSGGSVAESDSTIRTPTLMSPDRPTALTPIAPNNTSTNSGTLRRHSDVPTSTADSQTPTRPTLLDLSSSSNSSGNVAGNDPFFFPDAKQHCAAFRSLPVVSSDASGMPNGNGSVSSIGNAAGGGCRRPSSLLLPDSTTSTGSQKPPLVQQHSVGTKRPSSLFGLPCVALNSSLSSTASGGEVATIKENNLPNGDEMVKSLGETVVNSISAIESEAVMMKIEPAMDLQSQNTDQTSVTPSDSCPIGPASGRRSPSTCSANSEIIQLPVPTIPSSTSSYSPDSVSLSRSSLCDGVPSPMTQQPPPFIIDAGEASAVETQMDPTVDTTETVDTGDTIETLVSPESPASDMPPLQLPLEPPEGGDDMAALAALEAAVSSESTSRILPCGDTLGRQAPPWVPDGDAPICTGCGVRFTFTKRRHHCRACGKVYCNSCCSLRYHLEFLNGVARVCITCYPELVRLEARRHNSVDAGPPTAAPSALKNVLKPRSASSPHCHGAGNRADARRSKKKVVFSDGVAPGEQILQQGEPGELSSADTSPMEPYVSDTLLTAAATSSTNVASSPNVEVQQSNCDIARPPAPIVITAQFSWLSDKSSFMRTGLTSVCDAGESVVLTLNSRLAIRIQRVDLSSCCLSNSSSQLPYYAIVSTGLCAATESEYVVIIRTNNLPDYIEVVVKFYERLWVDADQGRFYDEFSCVLIEPVGFLVFRPSFQCTQHLPLPTHSRWLASVVIVDQNELAWARLFPWRLLLRLGHEFGHYPTPIVSDVIRHSLFHQPGHTVLSLFSDFRSFRYRLETIDGAVLHLDRACNNNNSETPCDSVRDTVSRRHVLLLPTTAANQVRQLAQAGNEHVLAIGTSFSPSADGHLVAVQASPPDTTYRTEAITMLGVSACDQIRVVAASFVIFNGSLRPDTNGSRARLTVLEDGAMVQITADQMTELRSALASKQNFTIACSTANMSDGDNDSLQIEWIQASAEISSPWSRPQIALRCRLPIGFNATMASSLSQVIRSDANIRVAASYCWPFDPVAQAVWCSPTVYTNAALSGSSSSVTDPGMSQSAQIAYVLDRSSLAFASAIQLALSPFADIFVRTGAAKRPVCDLPVQIVVRIRLDPDSLGFEATMLSELEGATEYLPLPDAAVESLDSELIPTLFNIAQALGAKLPPGGLCFEVTLFTMPPVVVSADQTKAKSTAGSSNMTIKNGETLAAEMLVDGT